MDGDKRAKLIKALSKLKDKVKTRTSFFAEDSSYHSLYLWAKHQEYLNEVLKLFKANTKQEYEELGEAVTKLELDKFFVDVKNGSDENQREIIKYVERIEGLLTRGTI